VAKRDLESDLKQAVRLRWSQLVERDPQLRRCADKQRRFPRWVGRSHEQEALSRWRELLHAPLKARFDAAREGSVNREPESGRQQGGR
jgi:hypothetical protein